MILPTTAFAVWIVAIVSLLCLGSWANTLKLAGKWRFEYFYYDFVFGILLCAGVAAMVLGSGRPQELTFQDNLMLSGYRKMAWALGSGVVLNLGTLLLLAAMAIAGMSVAFPVTLGVALVIGVIWDFANAAQANAPLTFMGVALLAGAVIVAGLAYVRLLRVQREAAQKALTPDPRLKSRRPKSAGSTLVIVLCVVGGIALSTFPKILTEATTGDNGLALYSAVLLLSVAAFLSSPFFVLFFTTFPVVSTAGMPAGYLSGTLKQHLMGVAGGILWGAGTLCGLMATLPSKDTQPSALIQYVLSHGALVLAAAWGLVVWQEFRGGGDRVRMLAAGMMVLFLAGLGMVAFAFSSKMKLHGRHLARVISYEMKCALGLMSLVLLALIGAAPPAFGGEYVVLSSGLKLRAERHEQSGGMIRLFYHGGDTEVPANFVSGFEEEEVVASEPVAAVNTPVIPMAEPLVPASRDPKAMVREAARRSGLPPEFVESVAQVESGFRPDVVSPKGALGVMQLMPGTAKTLGADPHDTAQNIDAGTRLLRELLLKYDGDVVKALAAYNAGEGAVDKYQGMPPYNETRWYVKKVIDAYQKAGGQ